MNIYEKLSQITSEMKSVAKNLEVNLGKNKYKAVGEADVLKAVKELEEKHKIYSYPYDRNIVSQEILTTEKVYNGETSKTNQALMRIEVTYRFVNIENPDEYIDIKSYGDGIDTGDKAPGKAMTYADKYALMKAYKMITGDDPDQEPSPEDLPKATQTKEAVKELVTKKATASQIKILEKCYTGDKLTKLLEANNINKLEELNMTKASEIIHKLYEINKKNKEEK